MAVAVSAVDITDEILAEYNERGYWISPKLFDDDEIAELRHELMRVMKGDFEYDCRPQWGPQHNPDSTDMEQYVNGWWGNARIRELIRHEVIADVASRLLGLDTIRLFHDQLLYKPGLDNEEGFTGRAEAGPIEGNVGWHQDYAHWTQIRSDAHCSAWIALQDTDEVGGCMVFIPGSHRWGMIEDAAGFGDKDLKALREKHTSEAEREWAEEPCIIKAGHVSFHTGLVMHGSGPNYKKDPRLSIVLNMMADGATYHKDGWPHPFAPLFGPYVKEGDPLSEPWFPVMGRNSTVQI